MHDNCEGFGQIPNSAPVPHYSTFKKKKKKGGLRSAAISLPDSETLCHREQKVLGTNKTRTAKISPRALLSTKAKTQVHLDETLKALVKPHHC